MVLKDKKSFKIIKNLKKAEIRYLRELKNVLFDKKWAMSAKNFPLYFMFRGLKEKNNIRYDITIIPPMKLGREFVKTKGHFHLGNFPEIYKVLSGEGIFLIQKGKDKVEDVYFVKGKKGDYILIPSGYGHATINPSQKTLKIANWISKNCLSDYLPIERKEGMCYYYTLEGWVKNKNYKKVPKLKQKRPIKKMPKDLSFLHGN